MTALHLFVVGLLASDVWRHFVGQFGVLDRRSTGVHATLVFWFFSHCFMTSNHIRVIVTLLVLWIIWRVRNLARFEGLAMLTEQTIFQVGHFIVQMGSAKL